MTYIPEALRRLVTERAGGRRAYCRLHEDDTFFIHEVDHIYAEKHGGPTVEGNLCIACADCNRHKGSDICSLDVETGAVVALYHPLRNRWTANFQLADTGVIEPLTIQGSVTARLLRVNRLNLVAERARLIALGHYPHEDT